MRAERYEIRARLAQSRGHGIELCMSSIHLEVPRFMGGAVRHPGLIGSDLIRSDQGGKFNLTWNRDGPRHEILLQRLRRK